ncbi:MAG: acyl-CoA dehydrogenase family protein [Deltaproteobacteria bacterium]|nr:acyl-CoA dehydrogenase family protein [Deltaproteobacteria bacterium]
MSAEIPRPGGGDFLTSVSRWEDVFVPEEFATEHRMIGDSLEKFIAREVEPLGDAGEKPDYQLTRRILEKAGEAGILGACLPEQYGGLGLNGVRFALIKEKLNNGSSSIVTAIGGQIGIGMLPIVFFGTDEQRRKYLPGLTAGTLTTAFALTEPWAGTDASAIRMSARLSDDGTYYTLNGTKVFITNAGFADIFVVFAKIDRKEFSAFIVERGSEGVTIGPEEQKMGLKGSSTCSLTFDDVRVPAGNLLGRPGHGHLFAFNVLNFGRLSVGAGCLGNAKEALECSVKYANQRVQFGRPISGFPLIAKKIAEMNVRAYVLESMVYRTAALMDLGLGELDFSDPDLGEKSRRAVGEYMVECAVNKVFGSETLGFVADEGLQIHGGYGYMKEFRIEGIYRDARIKRIFEGTNEINRLFIANTLARKVLKGRAEALRQAIEAARGGFEPELSEVPPEGTSEGDACRVRLAKRLFLLSFGAALEKYGARLEEEQEVCSDLGDMVIDVFAMESASLRARKILELKGGRGAEASRSMTTIFLQEALGRIGSLARGLARVVGDRDGFAERLSSLDPWRLCAADTVALKRQLAARVIEAERYVC